MIARRTDQSFLALIRALERLVPKLTGAFPPPSGEEGMGPLRSDEELMCLVHETTNRCFLGGAPSGQLIVSAGALTYVLGSIRVTLNLNEASRPECTLTLSDQPLATEE